jgi:hypothetical protein
MNLGITSTRDQRGLDDNSGISSGARNAVSNIPKPTREQISQLHRNQLPQEELSKTPIAKGIQILKSGLGNSFNSSVQAMSNGSGRLLDFASKNVQNRNVKSLIMLLVGGGFSLSFLSDALKLPGYLIGNKSNEKTAPTVLKIAKLVTGGTLGFGALNVLLKGTSLSHPTIIFGSAVFLFLTGLISSYENDNSLISKFLKLVGLRDDLKNSLEELKSDKLAPS